MFTSLKSAAAAIALAALAFTAAPAVQALPLIHGSFAVVGGASLPTGNNLLTTTELNFNGILMATGDGVWDYSTIHAGDIGTIVTSFVFDPLSGPINNFLSIDGFSFDLTDLVAVDRSHPAGGLDALTISATGMVRHANFEDTTGIITITANGTSQGLSVSFSGTGRSPIPEPATLALFGTALIGLTLARRRQKA